MSNLFLQLVNMSITAGWLVLALLLLRVCIHKAPKAMLCALWAVVALRLVCPFSIESAVSLLPNTEPIPQDILLSPAPQIDSGITVVDEALNPIITETFAPEVGASVNPLQVITDVAANVWLLGVIALLVYALISYWHVYRKTRARLLLERNVYMCDDIDTPFIFGIVRPRIYLPSTLNQADAAHVLAHERAHLKRRDHWWKPLGFLFLAIYWFNPMIWLAYILLCRDIELACDEHVLSRMGKEQTASYAEALLRCSSKQRFVTVCPLAFGESSVKKRIKYALSYKKPTFWIISLCCLASITITACFLTDPLTAASEEHIYDVSVSVKEWNLSAEPPTLTVTYHNHTDRTITYGEIFRLRRVEGEQFITIDRLENRSFLSTEYALKPHQSIDKTYKLNDFNLNINGTYRFETSVIIQKDGHPSHNLHVDFDIVQNLAENDSIVPQSNKAPSSDTGTTCESHNFKSATCDTPKTCTVCNTTVGTALGHMYSVASCTDNGVCQHCGQIGKYARGHQFTEADCTADSVCIVCGTLNTPAYGHRFSDVSCTSDSICERCGQFNESAHGHSFVDATCTYGGVCVYCDIVGSEGLGHIYNKATCIEDAVCQRCGQIGERAHGHKFEGVTCTFGGICVHCDTVGYAPGHSATKLSSSTCLGTRCETCGEYFSDFCVGHNVNPQTGYCVDCGTYDPYGEM